ncbi:kinase-like protein [Clavulina sp. PMI_390]|nr:kinase-like protein [Clavulina sp. PMI_390]
MGRRCIVVRESIMAVRRGDQPLNRECFGLVHREAIIHSQLDHPNILRFLGIYHEDDKSYPLMIFPFVERGSLEDLLRSFKSGQMMQPQDLIKTLTGTARGVMYLHSRKPPVIHGDLHPGNVLMGPSGDPLICDFGRSRIRHEVSRLSEREEGGRARFLAPELSDGRTDRFSSTQESDIFALAMTFLNAWSGKLPFHEIGAHQVITILSRGQRPVCPTSSATLNPGIKEKFWGLLVDMWAHNVAKRPSINGVTESLERIFGHCESSYRLRSGFGSALGYITSYPNWTRLEVFPNSLAVGCTITMD